MWKSILHHITNEHEWEEGSSFKKCAHATMTDRQKLKKKWILPQSPSYAALENIVLDPKILEAISKINLFCHTGALEVYHSVYTKFIPKRIHFSYKGLFKNDLCMW